MPFPFVAAAMAAGALASAYGAKRARDQANAQFGINVQQQREFAQRGIRWRVADAKAAGIHPLAALGVQTAQYSPISIGTGNRYAALGRQLSAMGQPLAHAMRQPTPHGKAMQRIEW